MNHWRRSCGPRGKSIACPFSIEALLLISCRQAQLFQILRLQKFCVMSLSASSLLAKYLTDCFMSRLSGGYSIVYLAFSFPSVCAVCLFFILIYFLHPSRFRCRVNYGQKVKRFKYINTHAAQYRKLCFPERFVLSHLRPILQRSRNYPPVNVCFCPVIQRKE